MYGNRFGYGMDYRNDYFGHGPYRNYYGMNGVREAVIFD